MDTWLTFIISGLGIWILVFYLSRLLNRLPGSDEKRMRVNRIILALAALLGTLSIGIGAILFVVSLSNGFAT